MKHIPFILLIGLVFSYFSLISCDKDSDTIIIEDLDPIPDDTISEVVGIYISTQDDFDKF